jgi:molecular chaperone DnaK (HSP70)
MQRLSSIILLFYFLLHVEANFLSSQNYNNVTCSSIGVGVANITLNSLSDVKKDNKFFKVLIPKGTSFSNSTSITSTMSFTTNSDNQSSVLVSVYSEDDSKVKNEQSVSTLTLSGIPPESAGIVQIEVEITIDNTGLVNIVVVNRSTGTRNSATGNITICREYDTTVKSTFQEYFNWLKKYFD